MRTASAVFLFSATLLAASGYGATFLFSAYFHSIGGTDIDTGMAFGAAMLGTFIGVPLVGWLAGRIDAAIMASIAACTLTCGFLIFGVSNGMWAWPWLAAGLIGLGYGMFYIGAPMSLSERVGDMDRSSWFMRFGAFQMAGIGGGPVVLGLLGSEFGLSPQSSFLLVSACTGLSAITFAAFKLTEPLPIRSPESRVWVRSIGAIAQTRTIRPIIMVCLGASIFSSLMSFQGSLLAGTGATAGTYFAIYTVTVVGARLFLARHLVALPHRYLTIGLLTFLNCGVIAMFGVQFHPAFQIASAMLTGIGYGLVYPVIQTWAVNGTPPSHRHAALTWFILSYFVGLFGFPVLGGWILVHFGGKVLLVTLLVAALLELAIAF